MKDFYTWNITAKISVHKDWVADGFDFRNDEDLQEQLLEMMSNRLPYANMSSEIEVKAKITKAPKREKVLKEQGYEK